MHAGSLYPFGDQLQLTIDSSGAPSANADRPKDDHPLDSIRDVFAALRSCWIAPDHGEARPGTELSVRLSFNRSGQPIGAPRLTYVTPGISQDVRQHYWDAALATVQRCTPLAFSRRLGGALAGRPLAIRFVDNRQPG